MNHIDRELAQAVRNLSALDKKAVPRASAMAVNRVVPRAVSRSSRDVAKTVKVTQKLIKERVRVRKATAKKPVSYVKVRSHAIPAIAIGTARTQIRRRKGRMAISQSQRNKQGRFAKREVAGYTAIRVGRHKFPNAFLQKLPNGRWHIMQRTTDARYPIKVCAVPIAEPVHQSFKKHSQSLMKTDMPKELNYAMAHCIRLYIRRSVGREN